MNAQYSDIRNTEKDKKYHHPEGLLFAFFSCVSVIFWYIMQVTKSTSRNDIDWYWVYFGEKVKGKKECFWMRKEFIKKGLS
jgi:hypothetical protein